MVRLDKHRGRILFLHGYTQSSSIFYAKTSALRKRLLKLGYVSIYLNGPHQLTPADLPSSDFMSELNSTVTSVEDVSNNRSWWIKNQNTNNRIDLSDAIDTINDYVQNNDIIPDEDMKKDDLLEDSKDLPIVGVIGFSQGAALAGILAFKFKDLFKVDSLEFVIVYSGFKIDTSRNTGNDKYKEFYPPDRGASADFKILHVLGELDTVVEEDRVMSLYYATEMNSTILKHPGGHFVPNSKPMVDKIAGWIEKPLEKNNNDENKSSLEDSNDITDLLNMMDQIGKE